MALEEFIGRRVVLRIQNTNIQDPQIIPNIQDPTSPEIFSIVATIASIDELGVWIEHPDYRIYNENTDKTETHRAHILVKYEYIGSIAAFPDLPNTGLLEEHRIGFRIEKE